MRTFIYLLCDPVTDEPRYVGASRAPARRLTEHIMSARSGPREKTQWIVGLTSCGLVPLIRVVEGIESSDADYVNAREAAWITGLRDEGYSILNRFAPGYGWFGPSPLVGRRRPIDHTRKIADANRKPHKGGWMHTDAARRAISEKRRISDDTIIDVQTMLAARATYARITEMTGLCKSSIYNIKRGAIVPRVR